MLDRSQSQQADVISSSYKTNQPELPDAPVVPGSAWKGFVKLFKKSSQPSPVQQEKQTITRQQIKCSQCQVNYNKNYCDFQCSLVPTL